MSNLPIRTYQRKNAAKQTFILSKNPSIFSRTNVKRVKYSDNNDVEAKEKVQNVDDTLEYDLFDTTFDRLAKDAVLPPVPPISHESQRSWYDSSDASLPMHDSSLTSTARELIRTEIKRPVKVVRKRKKKEDPMIAVVSKITRNKYPKLMKKIKQDKASATINVSETDICSDKSDKRKHKYNHKKKKRNIKKVKESERDEKHVFSQISNHSSNNSSIIDHELIVESVSHNNHRKVTKTESQSSDTPEITKATNTEEVTVKRKKGMWKMKIVLSPNRRKLLQMKKRKRKSEGNSSKLVANNDNRKQNRKKFKSMDNNALQRTSQDNQNQTTVDHIVNEPEINYSSSINSISMNSLNDASDRINKSEFNSSFNNKDNILMDSSNCKFIDSSKQLNSTNALGYSTTYSNFNKSSDNKSMDSLTMKPLSIIKAIAHSTPYPTPSNSVKVIKPTIIIKPCYVNLERYKKKSKQNYSTKSDKKMVCIPDFSHLPNEDSTYEHLANSTNNSFHTIIKPCSVKISRTDVDKFLKLMSTKQKTNGLQSDSGKWKKQFDIKDFSVNLSRMSPTDYKKLKLRKSTLPIRNNCSLMSSTPLQRPVRMSSMKILFSPIDGLTSIQTKKPQNRQGKPFSEDLSREKTDDLQDINSVKKNLHTYYNTSDVQQSKRTKSNIKVPQQSLSMDEQETVELEPESNKIKYSNSPVNLASDDSEDSIYSATTVHNNSPSGTNSPHNMLRISSDSDASQSLFGDTTTNEISTSSNDNMKRRFTYVTRRRAKKNSSQVQLCPVSQSDTVDTKPTQESSNTENISFEDSSLSPTEIMKSSQEIDTDTSTSILFGFTKVNSISKINCSNESLIDRSSSGTAAESLSMDSEYSKESQRVLEHCDSVEKRESVLEESVKSKEPKKRVHDDSSVLTNALEMMDIDNVPNSSPLTRRLHNLITIAKSRRSRRRYDLPLIPITESPFRGFPKQESTNGSLRLSLVDASCKIPENSNNLSLFVDDRNERRSIFLKPGKLWTRSLSILNNIQKNADLDALCVNKGKKWRQSVQAILAMQQQTPRKSRISGDTGVIQSCIKKNDNDKEPETHHRIPSSLNCLPNSQVNTTFGSTSPGRHIRRISIRVVPDNKKFNRIKHSPFLEAYGIKVSKSRKTFSHLSTQIAPLRETAVYNVECRNSTIESIKTAPPVFTAREVVLQRCNQDDYIPFEECFPKTYLKRCRKIGEGVYGEVFVHEGENENSVIKIIPIEGSELVNGETQKKFSEILSEIVIARELHNLRFNDKYNSSSFVEVKSIRCIVGKYPEKLVELWKIYDEDKNSDNDCPSMFNDNQLYIVLELGHGGQDLEAFVFQNASQSHALFIQTAFALAVAEKSLEFEHRDLHWGNILISHTNETEVHYKLNDAKVSFKTKGVQAAIIDFTLSRMSYQGCCIFNDLALDPALFGAQGEYQFEIYRLMRDKVNNDWQKFEPYTNLLWLHYTLDKMITGVRYKNKKTKVHKNAIGQLQELKDVILNYKSAFDFVTNCKEVSRLQCGNSVTSTLAST